VAAIAVLLLGLASVIAHAREYAGIERFSKDFALDYSSAKAVVDGGDPYASIGELVGRYLDPPPEVLANNILPGANWHTPFKLIVTVPLTALPYRAAGVLWLLLSAACIVAAGVLFGSELGWSRRAAFVLGVGMLGIPIVQIDLSAGQLNGPMLLVLVLTWRAIRRGHDVAGGIALGVLVALKFYPAFLALPLLAMRRYRAVFVAAGCAVLLTLGGALVLGADHARSFLEAGRGNEGFAYWDQAPANISWWGIATRWLQPNGWVSAGLDAPAAAMVLAVAGMVAWTAAALRPKSGLVDEPLLAAVPLMLLAWPIVWVHYPVLAIPWAVLAIRSALSSDRPVLFFGVCVTAIVLLMGFPPGGSPIERASSLEVAIRYQLPTAALLVAVIIERTVRVGASGVPSSEHAHTVP
jgi:alpha-1,2-mannosyltransferase